MHQLLGLNHRFVAPSGSSDLSLLTLNTFIANSPAVLIVFDDGTDQPPSLPSSAYPGMYTTSHFKVYNVYANSPTLPAMMADQLCKMAAQRTSADSGLFLLSWTLTTLTPRPDSSAAHAALFNHLWPSMTKESFPNFILLDGIGNPDSDNLKPRNVAALSVAIDQYFNIDCPT